MQSRRWIESAAKANYPRAQLQLLTMGIEDYFVNPNDVVERLTDLQSRVQTSNAYATAPTLDASDQKELKQKTTVLMRKELALRGLKWSNADFGDALMSGDLEVVKMYLDAGWNPLSLYEEGNALAHFIWRAGGLDAVVIEAMLKLFVERGVDPNAPVLKFRGLAPNTMAVNALRSCNSTALTATTRLGAITSRILDSVRQDGSVYPLNDGGINCESQIAKIGALLKTQSRCKPTPWGVNRVACELF